VEFPTHPVVGVGAVVVRDGKALIVKRRHDPRKGEWSLPGGHVKLGETLVEATRREILEETGLEVEVGEMIEVFDRIHRLDAAVRYHFVIVDFLCSVTGGRLSAGDDAEDVAWVSAAEAAAYGVNEHALRVLRRGLDAASRTTPGSSERSGMKDAIVRQAGAVAFRQDGERTFLLVRARRTPDQWIFPKGHIEPGETPEAAALREAREEAGAIGRIIAPLGPLEFVFNGRQIHVEYFLVEAIGDTAEHEPREQVWLSADAALDQLSHRDARRLLERALIVLDNS
jgi:8-oxo-dGTP diphosphatase